MMHRFLLIALVMAAGLVAVPGVGSAQPPPRNDMRVARVSLHDLGYQERTMLPGVYPSLTFNVPVSHALRSVRLTLSFQISPLADARSSLQVTVNDVAVFARYVGRDHRNARVRIDLPVPAAPISNMKITIKGYLYVTGDICLDSQSNALWMTVAGSSELAFTTAKRHGDGPIDDFFGGYGGRIVVVDRSGGGPATAALPYRLRQIEYWHQPEIVLANHADPHARNLVVRRGATRYDPETDTLDVDPSDLALIQAHAVRYLLSDGVTTGASVVGDVPKRTTNRVTFSELGFRPETSSGPSDLAFDYPIDASQLGGMPRDLQLHVAYAHTPLLANSTGLVQVQANGTLIASRELSSASESKVWDISIPPASVAPSNYFHILTSHYSGPGSCRGSVPQITTTVSDTSYLSWSGLDRSVNGIADFLRTVNGRVVLLVGDDALIPQAFHLMSELGRVNRHIGALSAQKFAGTVPAGYDYAIIVAPPVQLAKVDGPVLLDQADFDIVNPLTKQTLFKTDYDTGMGVLETTSLNETPALILSYWKKSGPLDHFTDYNSDTLEQQGGNLSLFSGTIETFDVGKKLRVYYAAGGLLEKVWNIARLPVAILLLIGIAVFISFALRRLTGKEHR